MRGRYAPQEAHAAHGTNSHIFSRNGDCFQIRTIICTSFQVLEPDTVDYDKVMGDMASSSDQEGGDQKAVQLATACSSVLNAKAGKEDDDASAQGERAAVSFVTSTSTVI